VKTVVFENFAGSSLMDLRMKLSLSLRSLPDSASRMQRPEEDDEKALPVKYGERSQNKMKPMCWKILSK
jgi:hypothetical protein